ncbi:ectoine/hydroxyectoine ABC transporter permease subunit EhuD [Microbacterium aerolatum]|jgi:polar amino acid transport system permease protein|uniref:ectoine/hydroxyectoine ABC transporter permease subunit EhuD n=1 Tax=Microbacterium aerolatum TaxID=153731 RepID=UPI002000EA04|nr:ectoine/hydroxyectoine ABC transporter permease subunit EhuD [Microbacterium aerolatum]MCK3770569.1 ectoine/hydroxyectoine ABC transporter permease subunit EhuD [Microbacterium aerolatum]
MNDDNSFWSWDHAAAAFPEILEKFLTVTLVVTIIGSIIAAVLGLVIALGRRTAPRPVSAVITLVMNFIRMTPLVVQLLFAYYVFTTVSPLILGTIIIGIHYATYMAEVYRAGIDAVPPGQWEATTALSMSPGRTWTAVIIPQALRSTLPALANYVISMFKDTPFLMVITVVEMVRQAQLYGSKNFRFVEAIIIAGLIYLVASLLSSLLARRLEKRLEYTTA